MKRPGLTMFLLSVDRNLATAMSLNNKIAIVTGGARGIGRGIVLALAKSGAKVRDALRI
jgi:hypothetical protein